MSQKLDLDFVDKPTFAMDRLSGLGVALFLIGLAFAIYVSQQYQSKSTQYQQLEATLQPTQPVKNSASIQTNLVTVPEAEIKRVRDTVAELTTPWSQLLYALEQTNQQNVALLSLEPSKKKQQLVLVGQAKNMQAALNYIQQLEKLPMLTQIYLQKHNVDQIDPFKPVSFTVVAKWQ